MKNHNEDKKIKIRNLIVLLNSIDPQNEKRIQNYLDFLLFTLHSVSINKQTFDLCTFEQEKKCTKANNWFIYLETGKDVVFLWFHSSSACWRRNHAKQSNTLKRDDQFVCRLPFVICMGFRMVALALWSLWVENGTFRKRQSHTCLKLHAVAMWHRHKAHMGIRFDFGSNYDISKYKRKVYG